MSDNAPPESSIVLYQTEDGRTRIECRFESDTIWLTQALIAELFQKDVRTVSEHLANIFEDEELSRNSTVRKFRMVRLEGTREVAREVEHYSLPAILAIGYRVRSRRGTQFRQWATARLSEYLVKGFTMDDERLKNPPGQGHADYFDELLERIRDIRASERRVYLRVRDILALAADYSPSEPETQAFFQVVQNKLHFAATGKTAPELIAGRADSAKPNMGLTAWKRGVVRKGDVTVAKNYLHEAEINELNRIVVIHGLQAVAVLLEGRVPGRQEGAQDRDVFLGPNLVVQNEVVDRHELAFSRPVRAGSAKVGLRAGLCSSGDDADRPHAGSMA